MTDVTIKAPPAEAGIPPAIDDEEPKDEEEDGKE
jgi:hypothetical protein